MTPQEKLHRLLRRGRKQLDDYGITVTDSELRTFPEGRAVLLGIAKARRQARYDQRRMARFGKAAAAHIDSVIAAAIVDHR